MVRTLLAVLAVVSLARADTVSFTQSMADWSNGQVISFAKFDTALGDLLDVHLATSASVGRLMDFTEIATPLGSYFGGIIQNNLALNTGMVDAGGFLSGKDAGYWPYFFGFGDAYGSPYNPGILDGSTTVRLSNGWNTDLGRFIGNDPWNITASASTFAYACRVPGGISSCDGPDVPHDLSATVSYNYTPVVATPEPRWTAALLVLFLMVLKITCNYRLRPDSIPSSVLPSGFRQYS